MKEIKNPPLPKLTLTQARKTALKKYKNQRDRLVKAVRKTGNTLTPSIPTISGLARVSTNNIKKLTRQLSTFTAQDARELFSTGKFSSRISISIDDGNVKISKTPDELTANKKPSKERLRVPKHDNPKIPVKQIIEEERERIIQSWREQGIPEEEITRRLVEASIPEPKDPDTKIPVKQIIEEERKRIEFERSRREQDEQEKNDLMSSEEEQADFSEGEMVYQTILSYIDNATYKNRASTLYGLLNEQINKYGFDNVMRSIESAPGELQDLASKLCFSSEQQSQADVQLTVIAEILTGEVVPDEMNKELTDEREEQEDFDSDNPFTSE